MSYTSQTKGDRNKAKFQASNINNVFKGKSTETQQKVPHRQYGMQVLGRVSNVRRMPRPSVLPSLKAETGGNDRVNLVPPGGQGWGGSAEPGGIIVRNSRAEALLDSPTHSQSAAGSGSSAQGGRAGGAQSTASGSAEARSWSRVTGGNAAGVGGSGGGGGGGSGSGGGTNVGGISNSGGSHNGWAPATGGSQALSAASQRDFPKLGTSTSASNVSSSDTSLRPQGSLSGNWRDRGRIGGVAVSTPTQQTSPVSPTSAQENADASSGGSGIATQGVPASGGSRSNASALAVSTSSRVSSHVTPFGANAVGNSRTFADTGSSARFDGTGAATSGGGGNRAVGKMPPPSRTSVPHRTTLDDKAANTAPTGWAADQGELDFSERIVFSDEEDESPPPPKPKQSDDKVVGSNANGDHNRHILQPNQISPELHTGIRDPVSVHPLVTPKNDINMSSHHPAGSVLSQESINHRKVDEISNIGSNMSVSQRSVMGLMQIPPGPTTSHHITITHPHPHQSQPPTSYPVGGVRDAWPSGPGPTTSVSMHNYQSSSTQQSQAQQPPPPQQHPSPQVQQHPTHQPPPHHPHHQHQGAAQYSPLLYTNNRVTQGHYGGPPPTAPHPSTIPFSSNPGPLMSASVPNVNPNQLFVAANEDKHLSDQRNLHQKEFKTCVERARMKKRTDESDVRGGPIQSSIDDERENQRRPRQRFDAPSTSSKGSVGDLGAVDDCESRAMTATHREETGPPGGPPMPPVPIVPPAPQQPTHSYPVPHGLQPHFGTITQGHYATRSPWHGAHPAGATAATYPHPAAQHPNFPHPYPPPAPLPTHLLEPNMRPKNTQELTVLVEKFQEFLRHESNRNDKNGKSEGDRTNQVGVRQGLEVGSKKVVEQADPFAEEENNESKDKSTALGSGDLSAMQNKISKRESQVEPTNIAQSNSNKRSQPYASREDTSQDHSSRRANEMHITDRDGQSGRGSARRDAWEERSQWPRRKSRDVDQVESNFGDVNQIFAEDEDNEDSANDRKRQGSRDARQIHSKSQKRDRNAGEHAGDQQGKRTKSTRGQRGAAGGNKPRGRGAITTTTYQASGTNFESEEELTRPPRGGSAGQLSRSSSSLAERSEWPSEELTSSTRDGSHRQYSQQHISQQPVRKSSGSSRRGGASNPSMNNRSRDYPTQQYATWGGSTGGSSRSYNNYHRNNARNFPAAPSSGSRHRYPVDHYSQSQYYDDYSYHYDYSMEEFGGQWHQNTSTERTKQSSSQGRRENKKISRDRGSQNRSSAPPASANEKSDSSHQSSSLSQHNIGQQQEQQNASHSKQHQQGQGNESSKGKREQQSRNREQTSKNVAGSGKSRSTNKKQGSTESNSSSGTGGNTSAVPQQPVTKPIDVKSDDDKLKEADEKPAVQLQPAPVPTVNVWNTKHPLIANAHIPGGPAPSNQNNETLPAPIDLMTATIPMSELRVQPPLQNLGEHSGPKPLIPQKKDVTAEGDDVNSTSESTVNMGSEARRGRETSKSRRERTGAREQRQPRSDRRGSGRRVGGNAASGVGNVTTHIAEAVDMKQNRDSYSQSSQNEENQQRGRRRRQNKEPVVENVEDQLLYGDEDYAEYENYMGRSYIGSRYNGTRSVRGARGYRGYHYRGYGGNRSYYTNYYPSGQRYYTTGQRYYGSQSRYRGSNAGGGRNASLSGNYDVESHNTAVYGSTGGKRQGSVSKETVTSDGNEQEDWETASESSDVANRDTRRRPPSGGSGGGGGAAGGGGSGSSNAVGGGSGSLSGSGVTHQSQHQQSQPRQRGRQHKTIPVLTSVADEKLQDDDSESGTPHQSQRKRNRMEGIDLNNFASVVAVDNLPEVTVDEEFLYDNAAEFVEVLSKSARKTKKREELKQKQEQVSIQNPRGRQSGRRSASVGDGLARRRNNGPAGNSGSGSGSPPKRLQSSKMTADERRRQKKVAALKPSGMVKPLLSSLSDEGQPSSTIIASSITTSTAYLPSTNVSTGGSGRTNKTKLPPRLAKQQQQQQIQQHLGNTTNAPPLMSLDSAELEQSILAADLSAGRKCQSVSAASVTDFKIESWDNSLAEDIPKIRRGIDQHSHAKQKMQNGRTDSPKPSMLAPIAPPNPATNGTTSTAKTDSGVDTGGEVSDRSSHSSGGATASENRSHSPKSKADNTVSGQAITLLDAAVVNSSLQSGDTVVDSSNEEYKLPDGFVLSCQRVTGDFDEVKSTPGSGNNSGAAERSRRDSSKLSEITVPVREVVDSAKGSESTSCPRNDPAVSVASSVSSGTTDEPIPLSTTAVTVTAGSGQSSTVEEGTSTLNKKIALVKSCWPEANDKACPPTTADGETGPLLTSAPAVANSAVNETETSVSSTVVINNVCKVKPQQKMTDSSTNVSSSSATVEEVSSSVSVSTPNVPDVHYSQTMSIFPGTSNLSSNLPASAPSFVPKATLLQQPNHPDPLLATGGAGVMYAATGNFQHIGTSAQPRPSYGPSGGTGAFAPPQPTNVGRPALSYSNGSTGKCPPVSLSIPAIAQQNAAKALGLGLGFGMSGSGGGDPSLLGHGAGTSNNAAVAALLQRQNSNSVGVIGPPAGPSTPQCSTYQAFNIPSGVMSNSAAGPSAATPTGGSWSPYGPNLSFNPGLPNPASGAQQAAAWTFLKNQNPTGPTGPTAPGLPSPNTPSPAPSRQPFIFNLWPIPGTTQTQQPAGSGGQPTLGSGNHLFGTNSGAAANKFPGTNPNHSSQLGSVPPPMSNIVNLPQFRGGMMDTNTNCNVPSSLYDTNPFPHQHPPSHQQQQPAFPSFTDFPFSQSQLPLKPHANATVPTAPSTQQMDILALITNELNARGTDAKTPTLGPLCMPPFSQQTQPHQQPPQHSVAVSRHNVAALNSNIGMPHANIVGKQNTMDVSSTGLSKPHHSGWGGTAGIMPASSASHIPSNINQGMHHPRSVSGTVAPPRSSPTAAGVCGNTIPPSTQPSNNRRLFGNNQFSHSGGSATQSGCNNQSYPGQSYKSYSGSNFSGKGSSVGYGGFRGSRNTRGSGHVGRGAIHGGSYRGHRGSNSSNSVRPNQSRGSSYGARGGSTLQTEASSRRNQAAQNTNSESENDRTIDKPSVNVTSTNTSTTSIPSHSSTDASTGSAENIAVTMSGCGDNSLSEPMNPKTKDSSGDIELDNTTRSAISLSPCPSDVLKGGPVDKTLLLDSHSEKFESVTLPSSVIQNNESSTALSLTSSTSVVDF